MSVFEKLGNDWVKGMRPYQPGRPIEEVARELGVDPAEVVKLASNENAWGPSPKAMEAMLGSITEIHRYPDGGWRNGKDVASQNP